MRLGTVLLCTFLASILMLSNILPSYAGDPVPGVDVSLEQIPGGTKNFGPNDSGIITVISNGDNVSPDTIDTIKAQIRSSTDETGLSVILMETTPNSGIFQSSFSLTDSDRSSGTTLRVTLGDTITAEFKGVKTNGSVGGDVDLKSSTKDVRIKEEVPSKSASAPTPSKLDAQPNVEFYDLRFTDSFGNLLEKIQANQQAIITATLINKQENQKDFTFIVNCDKDGKKPWKRYLTASINPGAKIEPSLSLIFSDAGTYKCTGMIEIPNYKSQLASISTSIIVKQKVTEDVQKAADKAVSEGSSSSDSDVQTKNFNSEEVAMINNIISKLKVVSQSNSEVQKLLSQLEEVWNQPAKAKKEQSEADAAKEKAKGLNAVNVKKATAQLKEELKSNPKALKLLMAVEAEISKVAKVSSDKAIDLANFNKAMSKLKDELSKSNPEALKSVREVTDTIEQMAENHNTTRSCKC